MVGDGGKRGEGSCWGFGGMGGKVLVGMLVKRGWWLLGLLWDGWQGIGLGVDGREEVVVWMFEGGDEVCSICSCALKG